MDGTIWVLAAAVAFLGTHYALSHPLRKPIVDRIGEWAFFGLYSLVAALTLGWLVWAYLAAPAQALWWPVAEWLWGLASLITLAASILLVGSLIGNPAFPNPGAAKRAPAEVRGVFAITRHPMMWAFALWGVAHIAVYPTPANVILSGAIILLALGGAALQDLKKQELQPEIWEDWRDRTSYWPYGTEALDRTTFAETWPGWGVMIGGVLLWLAATWAHMPLAGMAAGVWQWVR
jgi:uncharacterized membrane protein